MIIFFVEFLYISKLSRLDDFQRKIKTGTHDLEKLWKTRATVFSSLAASLDIKCQNRVFSNGHNFLIFIPLIIKTHFTMLLMLILSKSYLNYYIKITMLIYVTWKAYSSYSSECRKLKIGMSNGYTIPHKVRYFMFLKSKY